MRVGEYDKSGDQLHITLDRAEVALVRDGLEFLDRTLRTLPSVPLGTGALVRRLIYWLDRWLDAHRPV